MAGRERMMGDLVVPSPLDGAVEAHISRFGSAPQVSGLEGTGRDRQLADLIWVSIRIGKPFDAKETARAWGRQG